MKTVENRAILNRRILFTRTEDIKVEPVNDNYIGIDEVAEYLGVKASTVRTWIKTKGLPGHKIGGKLWKFKKSEIDEWVDSDKNQK